VTATPAGQKSCPTPATVTPLLQPISPNPCRISKNYIHSTIWFIEFMKHALCVSTRLSYASCICTFLCDVFKLLTLTIAVNISKDQVFYMLKPMLFCIADINQTFCELKNRRKEEKTGLGDGEEASAPVVAGVKDLMVCMKDTGMYLKLTLPNTILRQKIKDIGRMRLQRSAGLTSISGFNCSTLIAMWAPIVEQIKCTVDTVKGNLKSNLCMHPSIHTHIL
jgi:hypothetical protein